MALKRLNIFMSSNKWQKKGKKNDFLVMLVADLLEVLDKNEWALHLLTLHVDCGICSTATPINMILNSALHVEIVTVRCKAMCSEKLQQAHIHL